jgi:Protein of unknown function (DUF1674)
MGGLNAHLPTMSKAKRPRAPDYLSKSPPVPHPELVDNVVPPDSEEQRLDPTRYGDWEKKGIAIDF